MGNKSLPLHKHCMVCTQRMMVLPNPRHKDKPTAWSCGDVRWTGSRSLGLFDDSRILRRTKRRWVLTTIQLEENDTGPFPKHAGDLFNDQAENYTLKYLISGPGVDMAPEVGLFFINDKTGEVFVTRPIDREKTALFVVSFDVADRSNPDKILDKSLIFNVEVIDKNDNAPRFTQKVYEIPLKETINLDSPIFGVLATDDDKEETPNSEVTFYLINQIPSDIDVKFTVDPKSGLISGKGCISYEATDLIRLTIGAKDSGNPSLSNSTTVNFRVMDGNNNMPVFIIPLSVNLTVKEGEQNPELLRLKVEDKDTPKTPAWNAKYKILVGNENDNYNITTNPETNEGILMIQKPLDFEGTPTKIVVISVENEEPYYSCKTTKLRIDKTATPANLTLYITVQDANDAPVFSPPSKIIREKEGVKVGTVLGTFTANDPDMNPNKIKYKVAEDPAGFVTVDENTGVVTTKQELDRESPFVNNTVYKVVVHAIDDGEPPATGSGTVLLYISDINDNTPELVTPYVQRCESQSDTPFTVEATDKDMDPFGGPFKFDLSDHSRSTQETWKINQINDNAVEVVMLKNLGRGNHSVHLDIYDRQGTYKSQALYVMVCGCPDGLNCEKMAPASYSLGGGAIGAIIGALLFLLLALCLLTCFLFGSGKKKDILPEDEGNQTLIKYNEEGGSALSQAALLANANGIVENGIKETEAVGRSLNNSLLRGQYLPWETEMDGAGWAMPRAQYQSWEAQEAAGAGIAASTVRRTLQNGTLSQEAAGAGIAASTVRRTLQNGTLSQNSKYMRNGSLKYNYERVFVDKVGEMLNKRLRGIPVDVDVGTYKPRVYAYEGELEKADAFEPFIYPEQMDFSFLDQFDPKFAQLEAICKQ
ncbi:cadherin-like protein 26 isoform X3 [Hyperolius riggenbachi]|uniref:cadherin-like protein 26 isoform X3 n=1 Tax=Hyperolius riggenbachi TaxID=752182 RepID=UPI0035A2ABD2